MTLNYQDVEDEQSLYYRVQHSAEEPHGQGPEQGGGAGEVVKVRRQEPHSSKVVTG